MSAHSEIGDYVAGDVDKGSSQAVLAVADGATADASQMLASETPPEDRDGERA